MDKDTSIADLRLMSVAIEVWKRDERSRAEDKVASAEEALMETRLNEVESIPRALLGKKVIELASRFTGHCTVTLTLSKVTLDAQNKSATLVVFEGLFSGGIDEES
ncbi:hypothetical protein PROFUN_01047 [Planoprotostelium fungivorum]|uniref:Uncharacterized protein n=1 Tax=Planoprotostelium fungivorum TaxID=1890364 RepID=A0A2P6N4K5_9EUKA|nr:hypothetical protein PROFUN_01047 [Planoprotostelium fungivorum]